MNNQTGGLAKKILHFPLTKIILASIVVVGIPVAVNKLALKPALVSMNLDEGIPRLLRVFFTTAVLMTAAYWWFFRTLEKRKVSELDFRFLLKDSLIGFFSGIMVMGFVITLLWINGFFIVWELKPFWPVLGTLIFIFSLALTEEIFFRGIIYRIMEENLGTNIALAISALLFGLSHLTNENMSVISLLGIIIGGCLMGLLYTATRRLWLPIFAHAGWNYIQTLTGVTLSGSNDLPEASLLDSSLEGPELITGGGFGPENSILTIVLTAIILIALYRYVQNKGKVLRPKWKQTAKLP
ncbi:MAG: CPBP family intramembrane metalloprotease [FCB group bacterium]|nr:CPBP family intramembrane metalloprotease [FCB group bacterium]